MKTKFFCAHGHFYQPPREDPWLGHIEKEASASPFENWNQKIFHECYLKNAFSPRHSPSGKISKFLNNYAYINFDFGPTLLNWLEKEHP
ncbi:MAG: glycoside hydrolase, partial [Elusimicrobiota bacterium]|nr:glycoside hydrolase [Elusimicrobiota bacterium]